MAEDNKLIWIGVGGGLALAVGLFMFVMPKEPSGTIQRPRAAALEDPEARAAARKKVADTRARIASKEVAQGEAIPPVNGAGELTQAQITYCLSENVRIEAGRPYVSGAEAQKNFDGIVKDYNSRCGDQRYREPAYTNAKRAVERISGELRRQGIERFKR